MAQSNGGEPLPNEVLVNELRLEISRQLAPYSRYLDNFALIDFPNHSNVGDSAIWLGEIDYFLKTLMRRASFVCDSENYNPVALRRAVPSGPIFIHGGGNFGDIWSRSLIFRNKILNDFPGRLIIQLPQSIHFNKQESINAVAEAIARHGNLVLFVRDLRSLELAQYFRCKSYLAPDMAFHIGVLNRTGAVRYPLLLLLRTDIERVINNADKVIIPRNSLACDWLDEVAFSYENIKKTTILTSLKKRGMKAMSKNVQRELLFENLAKRRLERGIDLLSSAAFVISDRLHVHILCLLLGIPHICLDNVYGKISSYRKTWTHNSSITFAAHSLEEALEIWHQKR